MTKKAIPPLDCVFVSKLHDVRPTQVWLSMITLFGIVVKSHSELYCSCDYPLLNWLARDELYTAHLSTSCATE